MYECMYFLLGAKTPMLFECSIFFHFETNKKNVMQNPTALCYAAIYQWWCIIFIDNSIGFSKLKLKFNRIEKLFVLLLRKC